MLLGSHPVGNSKGCFLKTPWKLSPKFLTHLSFHWPHGFRSRSPAYFWTNPWQGLWDYPYAILTHTEAECRVNFPLRHMSCIRDEQIPGNVEVLLGGRNSKWISEDSQECLLYLKFLCTLLTSVVLFFPHWIITELFPVSTFLQMNLYNKSKLSFNIFA